MRGYSPEDIRDGDSHKGSDQRRVKYPCSWFDNSQGEFIFNAGHRMAAGSKDRKAARRVWLPMLGQWLPAKNASATQLKPLDL